MFQAFELTSNRLTINKIIAVVVTNTVELGLKPCNHVACKKEVENAHKIFIGQPEGKRQLERIKHTEY